METILEKITESNNILLFQIGMRGSAVIQGNPISARFIWKDDKWWHVLIDPMRYQPNWIRVRISSLEHWVPDLADPATAGIVLARISFKTGSPARFLGESLLLEDGRVWSGETRQNSLELYLKD
jgi:hypothetical protein